MTRVVVDTNVLVSALLKERGAEAAVLDLLVAGKLYWCISDALLTEYREVLCRPKFAKIPRFQIEDLLTNAAAAYHFNPSMTASYSVHGPDNRFLECAEEAAAAFLITGNKRHFPAQWKGTKILNARELLNILSNQPSG